MIALIDAGDAILFTTNKLWMVASISLVGIANCRNTLRRHAAGMSVMEAVQDISFEDFSSWGDAERIAVNVDTLYKEFNNDPSPSDIVQLFAMMSKLAA